VRLLLVADQDLAVPRVELALDSLVNKSGRVQHGRVAESLVEDCRYYGYVVDGPDPRRPVRGARLPSQEAAARSVRALRRVPPSFGKAPLGMIVACEKPFAWSDDRRPRHKADALMYELHVRGFTQHPTSGVSEAARGAFVGVVEKIPYCTGSASPSSS
jgi:isoamylase